MRETIRLIATNAEQTNLLALNDTVRIIVSIAGVIKRVNDYRRKIAESVIASTEITQSIAKVDSVLTETAAGAAQSQQSDVELTDLANRCNNWLDSSGSIWRKPKDRIGHLKRLGHNRLSISPRVTR
jgi:methyl-accepting chemotaxis protein